jgi:hypothetical protein
MYGGLSKQQNNSKHNTTLAVNVPLAHRLIYRAAAEKGAGDADVHCHDSPRLVMSTSSC